MECQTILENNHENFTPNIVLLKEQKYKSQPWYITNITWQNYHGYRVLFIHFQGSEETRLVSVNCYMCTRTHACRRTHAQTHMHSCRHTCTDTHTHTDTWVHTQMHTQMRRHIQTLAHTHTDAHWEASEESHRHGIRAQYPLHSARFDWLHSFHNCTGRRVTKM